MPWTDAVAPAAIAAVAVLELLTLDAAGRLGAGVIEVLACAVLVLRRRAGLVTGTVAGLLCAAPPWVGPAFEEVSASILIGVLASYTLARWVGDHRGLVGLGATLVAIAAGYLLVDARDHGVSDVVFVLALLLPPYFFGRVTRRLAVQSDLIAAQAEQLRDQAVRDERDRIARELHDVIAHSVSAMVVQTAAAQDLVRTNPEQAATLLENVAETGRRALSETGRLLHLVRDEGDELGLAPAPGLADVPALVAEVRTAGLAVDARVDPPATPLPGGVDVSVYRVVQEALTNALKYGEGPALLEIGTSAGRLRIRCSNRVGPSRAHGSGLGLTGMAERVAVLGGTLQHGRVGDRFELEVTVPLPAAVEVPT